MSAPHSHALVFLGATDDLAHEKIFPAEADRLTADIVGWHSPGGAS